MPAIRCFPRVDDVASSCTFEMPALFGDDYGLATVEPSGIEVEREDAVWEDLPIPVSVSLPLDGPLACEAVLPAHYEPGYAYPLIVWLSPTHEIDFRERMMAISDRNFLGLALHWLGFNEEALPSVTRAAECRHLMDTATSFVDSVWNVHPNRRFLVAEGAVACTWGFRLLEHSPQQFESLVCIRPDALPSSLHPMRIATAAANPKRVMVCVERTEFHDDRCTARSVIDSWQRHASRREWSIEFRQVDDDVASLSRFINQWLMTQGSVG